MNKCTTTYCSMGYKPITNGYYWVYCKFHNTVMGAFCVRNESRNLNNKPISIDGKLLYYYLPLKEFLKISN